MTTLNLPKLQNFAKSGHTECDDFHLFTSDEILECIAGWKEGSSRYLVARFQPHPSSLRTSTAVAASTVPSVRFEPF